VITLRSDGWDWGTGVDSAKTHTLQSNEVRSIPDCGLSRRKQHTHWNLGRFLEVTLWIQREVRNILASGGRAGVAQRMGPPHVRKAHAYHSVLLVLGAWFRPNWLKSLSTWSTCMIVLQNLSQCVSE
jgi:hypothetical protein